jgi:hypothetical protein
LKILQLNVRCLSNKLEELEIFFEEHKPDIVCISEHWQKEEAIESITFKNYYLANYFCRSVSKHGGVAILVKSNIQSARVQLIDDLSFEFHCELVAIEITCLRVTVISAYHSPPPNGNYDFFIDRMQAALANCKTEFRTILAGDFNVNLLSNSNISKTFKELCQCFGLTPLFTIPTREFQNSKTCIDNVVTDLLSDPDKLMSLNTGFSDHKAQCCELFIDTYIKRKTLFKTTRKFSPQNFALFRTILLNINWKQFSNENDSLNEKFDRFHDLLTSAFDQSFPLLKSKDYVRGRDKSWITAGIKISSKKLKMLRLMKNGNNNLEFLNYFRNYKRIFYKVCRSAKRFHYNAFISKVSINKTKSIWKFIKSNKNQNYCDESITLHSNGHVITDPCSVATTLNAHFNRQPRILQCEHSSNLTVSYGKYRNVAHTVYLEPITENELLSMLAEFNNKKAVGFDNISCDILIQFKDILIRPLLSIINDSLSQGIFPERLKLGIIKPLHKGKNVSKNDPNNFRPICNLSIFSKILEKCYISRLTEFFKKHKVFIPQQHGFVEGRSTITALFDFLNGVYEQIDSNLLTYGIFFDIKKAFDSVDHDILLEKAERLGVRGVSSAWLRSYLNNRKVLVEIESLTGNTRSKIRSGPMQTNCGVVQGSVIGPFLFVLFASDVILSENLNSSILYADDISIVVSAVDKFLLSSKAQSIVNSLTDWAHHNKLEINQSKSYTTEFFNRHSSNNSENLGCGFENIDTFKLLGLTLDSKLTWVPHVDRIAKNIASGCYLIRRLKDYCEIDTLRIVYFAYVQSFCSYGVIFWGHSSNIYRILKLQKWAIRAMLGLRRRESCKEHFRSLKILTIPALVVLSSYKFVIENKEKFFMNDNTGNRLRLRHSISYPSHRTSLYERGPFYQCAKIFNKLPACYRKLDTDMYKKIKTLKNLLIDKCPYTIEAFLQDL